MLEGHFHPDFSSVDEVLRRLLPREGPGGAAVCVYHRGECVVDLWGGSLDADGRPWREDTLVLSYSTTKGVVSTLLHVLVDRGLADYDDPVARHWPEFAAEGKQSITLRQLLSHRAGLYAIRGMIDDARRMLDWHHMVEALERSRPLHPPGRAAGYHALTYGWLVGELIQRIGRASLPRLLQQEIAEPLALKGLFVGLPDAQLTRRALLLRPRLGGDDEARGCGRRAGALIGGGLRRRPSQVDFAELECALMPEGIERLDFNAEALVQAVMPSVNGMFDARSLARMYAALACGGRLDGVRLLSERTLARACEIQSRAPGRVLPLPMQWRLGYHQVPAVRTRLPRAFGHFGIGGSGAWADPERQLAVALVLNSGLSTPFGDTRLIRLGSAAALAAQSR